MLLASGALRAVSASILTALLRLLTRHHLNLGEVWEWLRCGAVPRGIVLEWCSQPGTELRPGSKPAASMTSSSETPRRVQRPMCSSIDGHST